MHSNCTVYKTMDFLGKRWTLLILLELYKGREATRRFSELKGKLPDITPKMLSSRLKELEREGMIDHTVDDSTQPPKSMYTLTKSGMEFMAVIGEIKSWALRWKFEDPVCESLECKDCQL